MGVLSICISAHHMHAQCPQVPKELIRFPETEVTVVVSHHLAAEIEPKSSRRTYPVNYLCPILYPIKKKKTNR